jgi:hypothetical protein
MDHGAYMKKVKRMTEAELTFVAKDALEAANAFPEGENAGYYLDEALYCQQELAARSHKQGAK